MIETNLAKRKLLLEEKLAIETDIDRIKSQLEAAQARVHSDGTYSDAGWYAKANAALRFKRREAQRLQQELSALKTDRSILGGWQNRFIEAARRRLSAELFAELSEEATFLNDGLGQ